MARRRCFPLLFFWRAYRVCRVHPLAGFRVFWSWEGFTVVQPSYLSEQALEKLKAELEHLRTVGRHNAAEKIQQSRERGGTVSDAEYEEAKNELAFTEGRILTLENMVDNAIIIVKVKGRRDTVEVGATVTVKTQGSKTTKYTFTGSAEADPSQGKISNASPIGKSLLGKKVGEVTEVNALSGKIKLEIISIR